jgi:uncharacterized protein with HEPN domain
MNAKPQRVVDYLQHMQAAIWRVQRYTVHKTRDDFMNDEQLQDAVIRNIEIIGEAARNISVHGPEFVAAHPEVPWTALYAMRNRVAHGYWSVDTAIVWQVIRRDLPILDGQLTSLLRLDGTKKLT